MLNKVDYLVWKIEDKKLLSSYEKLNKIDLSNSENKDILDYIKSKIWLEIYERGLQ